VLYACSPGINRAMVASYWDNVVALEQLTNTQITERLHIITFVTAPLR
jgi:hypothetical protein